MTPQKVTREISCFTSFFKIIRGRSLIKCLQIVRISFQILFLFYAAVIVSRLQYNPNPDNKFTLNKINTNYFLNTLSSKTIDTKQIKAHPVDAAAVHCSN